MFYQIIFDWKRTIYDLDTKELIDGALALLEFISGKNIPMILIGKGGDDMQMEVNRLGAGKYFKKIAFAEGEKDPKIFADYISKINPKETIVVGDRVRSELEIGNKLGATTIWVKQGKFANEEPENADQIPDYKVASLIECLSMLQKLLINKEIASKEELLLTLLKEVALIASPTGSEQQKMLFLKKKLKEMGQPSFIDSIGNCITKLPAKKIKGKKTILVVAHADTACDPGKNHKITEDSKYLYGHGICDNSAGVTGLLTIISLLKKHKITFSNDLIFAFTVGEEGLGGKRGMKQVIKDYGSQIDAVINVESHHIGRVTNQVIGQYRSELLIDTKIGGHSFRDFGRPNANVILAQIISDFSRFKLPQAKGKTTFNFGQIKGDGSINAIAKNASCLFEIRSENNKSLQKTKQTFKLILQKHRKQHPDIEIIENVSAEVPAVIFPSNHRIYKITMDVQKELGIVSKIDAGNTDGDVSLAKGIPTVTIGTSEGWNTHSLNEYMDKKLFNLGIKQVFGVVDAIASSY